MVDLYSLQVAVERERARRLVDRFGRDDSEGGELARERRAHHVSAAVRRELERRQSTGSVSEAFASLEASLDARSRSKLQSMLHEDSLAPRFEEAKRVPAEPPAPTIAPIGKRIAAEVEPSPPEDSAKVTSEALQGSLDDMSVKSVLDFRSVGAGVFAAESVATAATCAIANIDDTVRVNIHSLNPDCPWPGALQVLSKPGHFINSLRRFPKAVEERRVPEDNVVAARHYLGIAPPKTSAEFHPAVRNLSRWVDNAIRYWEHHSREKDDADNDRQKASLAAKALEAERQMAEKQAVELGVGFGGATASNASPTTTHRPPAAAPSLARSIVGARSTLPARSLPGAGDTNRSTASTGNLKQAFTPTARPSASPRTRARVPTGTTTTMGSTHPSWRTPPGPTTSTRMSSSPSRSSIPSTTATGSIRSGTSTAVPRSSVSTPSPVVATAMRPTPSPQSRRNVSPRPAPAVNSSATTSDYSRRSPLRPSVALRPSASGSPAPTRSSPRRSPRTSPMAKSPAERLAVSKSASSLGRQVRPVQRHSNGQIVPAIPMVNGSRPESLQEFRRMLEETKREVRDIKAIESQLKWNMQREEKKEKSLDEKAAVEEIRDWRWRQSDEMKAYRTAKAQAFKATELKESRSFQEFKREVKERDRLDERRQVEEIYLQDRENAQWRAELAKVAHEKEKEICVERVEDYLEHRDIRNNQKLQERLEADENRALEQTLEMHAIAREIQMEKEQLLRNLEHSRAACQRSPQRNAFPPSPELGRLS